MKITDVTLTLFTWDGLPPTEYTSNLVNLTGKSVLGLVRISTDEGIEGHSFLGSTMRPATLDGPAVIEWLKPMLMGQDPLERERLYQRMRKWSRTFTMKPMGAVDVALWDIAGKAAGLPIHRLLGTYRTSIPVYAASQNLKVPEAFAEQAQKYKALGYPAYKIHPTETPDPDIEICQAVRRAVGDGYTLMLDASYGYNYEQALRVGRAIEQLGFHWYEDPMGELDIYSYKKLCADLDVPVMATELPMAGFDSYAIWITERATDILRGDVPLKGGITTMIKTAHLAEAFGMQYEIHHGQNPLNNVAGLHVAMAIKNCEFYEWILPEGVNQYALAEPFGPDKNGLLHAPMKPGLGVEIDFELIKKKTISILR